MKKAKTILIGISLSCTVYILLGLFFAADDVRGDLIGIIALGTAFGLLSLVYYSKKLPLLLKTLIQLIGGMAAFLTVAYVNRWFPFSFEIIATSLIIFLAIFFAIWTVFYLKEKREITKINHKINPKT